MKSVRLEPARCLEVNHVGESGDNRNTVANGRDIDPVAFMNLTVDICRVKLPLEKVVCNDETAAVGGADAVLAVSINYGNVLAGNLAVFCNGLVGVAKNREADDSDESEGYES